MSYGLTDAFSTTANKWIEASFLAEDSTQFQRQVCSRLSLLAVAPLQVITGVADTILGTTLGVASLVILGKSQRVNSVALGLLFSASRFLSISCASILLVFNPKREMEYDNEKTGLIAGYVGDFFKTAAESLSDKSLGESLNWKSRLIYVASMPACLVTRAMDGMIAPIAATLAFLTLGKVHRINEVAFRSLQFTEIALDLYYSALRVIRPEPENAPEALLD